MRAQTPNAWPVDSVISTFERESRERATITRASYVVMGIIQEADARPARRDSLVAGLENLALTSESENVRHKAAVYLAMAGTTEIPAPTTGLVPRLARIYRSGTPLVQLAIRNQLPLQADRRAALALLREIAAGPDPYGDRAMVDYHGDDRVEALERLSEMGEEGRAVLQAMHRSGEARSPQARAVLEQMARRGFPVRDIRRP